MLVTNQSKDRISDQNKYRISELLNLCITYGVTIMSDGLNQIYLISHGNPQIITPIRLLERGIKPLSLIYQIVDYGEVTPQ